LEGDTVGVLFNLGAFLPHNETPYTISMFGPLIKGLHTIYQFRWVLDRVRVTFFLPKKGKLCSFTHLFLHDFNLATIQMKNTVQGF